MQGNMARSHLIESASTRNPRGPQETAGLWEPCLLPLNREGEVFLPPPILGHLARCGDSSGAATGIWWVQARDAATQCSRQAPQQLQMPERVGSAMKTSHSKAVQRHHHYRKHICFPFLSFLPQPQKTQSRRWWMRNIPPPCCSTGASGRACARK